MNTIIVAETYSTPGRVEANARRLGNAHYLVLPDGTTKPLAKVNGHDEVLVILAKGKAGERIFTSVEMSYVVPPLDQLEGLWMAVQGIAERLKMAMTFSGVEAERFRWGWVERLEGVAAKGRVSVGQGGFLPEFYCLLRFRGMSEHEARREAVARAKENVPSTPLPRRAAHAVVPPNAGRRSAR